jgi:ubiquinone/menaquinone biosynthesis C-methylase UbiE
VTEHMQPGMEEEIRFPLSRVTRRREQARASYDRISGWYDVLEGAWETKARKLGLQKIAAGKGETLLEIGGGTGYGVLALAQAAGDKGMVCDIDLSPRMLGVARARLDAHGLAQRVLLASGDAVHLPCADETFDAIFMSFVLELFDSPEIPQVLLECRRALRIGGRIVVVSLSRADGLNRIGKLYEWGHRHFPALLDCRMIYVQQALHEAGFVIRDVTRMSLYGLSVEVVLAYKL